MRKGEAMRLIVIAVTVVIAGILAAGAAADGVYHATRIPLHGVGDAPGGGTVVNIHANGPVVYAHEVYVLEHSQPGSYQVMIHIYPASQDCTGDALDLPTAILETNAEGNGKADVKFTPGDADGLRGLTLSAFWTAEGPASYTTDCSVITLD
jgi:hypothetical protein